MSLYEWTILDGDEKPQTNKHIATRCPYMNEQFSMEMKNPKQTNTLLLKKRFDLLAYSESSVI